MTYSQSKASKQLSYKILLKLAILVNNSSVRTLYTCTMFVDFKIQGVSDSARFY